LWLAIPLEVRGSRGTNLPVAVMRLGDRVGMLSRISQRKTSRELSRWKN
jgi:hypothetical protein